MIVGSSKPRIDAYERVSGTAVYPRDISLPDMLHAAILRCPHAHARVAALDASMAERMPGVRAVMTTASPGADIPWYQSGEKAASRLLDPECRYAGDEVAAVAAETLTQARDALGAIKVEYEILPFVIAAERGTDVHPPLVIARGDVEKGFQEADAVVEQTYRTSCQLHTPMEVHGSVARWEGDRLTVWDTTQGVFDRQRDLAGLLRLPLSHVRVVCTYMGGGFGSKLATGKYTVIAALLARQIGRPVKLFLPREETFVCVGNRPAHTLTLKAGARKDGTITALALRGLGEAGAYPTWAIAGYQVEDLYRCANVRREERTVLLNAGQARPMRAPGFPQCSWALEQIVDSLAEAVGMDPVEFRLKNIPTTSAAHENKPYTSTGLSRCLSEGAAAFGWADARKRRAGEGRLRRGVGVAAAVWGYEGDPRATAIVKLFADGSVMLTTGASDIGTGTKTILAMVVADALTVPLERIEIEHADTLTTPFAPASGGSQTALVNAPAVLAAATDIKRQLLALAAEEMQRPLAQLSLEGGRVVAAGEPATAVPLAELKALQARQNLVAVGHRAPMPAGKIALPFAAHFAEVEVDTVTGRIRVVRLLGAHDSGRPLNLLTYRNQVFGGMAMGLGFGTTERRLLDSQTGRMLNANWHDYKIPTALDVPDDMTCLPIDPQDTECNSTGTKGLGEPATIPTAAAIANAVYHAVGIRMMDAPLSPISIVRLLAAGKGRS